MSPKKKAALLASGVEHPRSSIQPSKPARGVKRSAIKKKARKPSETLRIYGPKARRVMVKAMECFGCLLFDPIPGCMVEGQSENAHVCGNEGMSRKGHYTTITALGKSHHHLYDHHLAPFDDEDARRVIQLTTQNVENAWQARSPHDQRNDRR